MASFEKFFRHFPRSSSCFLFSGIAYQPCKEIVKGGNGYDHGEGFGRA